MTWLPGIAAGNDNFARVLDLRPELRQRHDEFVALFAQRQLLDPHILEICRARVVQLLRSDAPPLAGHATDIEATCLAFTDKFVLDPHGVTDGEAAAVIAHLGEPRMIAFVQALALFDGFERFRAVLDIRE